MQMNPYEVTSKSSDLVAPSTPRTDGKYLVVQSGDTLPNFCVRTATEVEQHTLQRKKLTWCSPLLILVGLLSGPLLILGYLLFRKHCVLHIGLAAEIRAKYRKWRRVKVALVVVLFLALPLVASADNSAVSAIFLIAFFVAFISLFIGNSPIAVRKYRKGEFWISGCSPEFLRLVAS